jgi:hypothetical protein
MLYFTSANLVPSYLNPVNDKDLSLNEPRFNKTLKTLKIA